MNVNSRNYTPKFIRSLTESYNNNFMRRPERSTFVIERDGILIGTGSIIIAHRRINDIFIDVENHRKGFVLIPELMCYEIQLEASNLEILLAFQ